MKYKYNIKHKVDGKAATINFKNKQSMLNYLDKNTDKLNQMVSPALHFNTVVLPLKQTTWYVKPLSEHKQKKLNEKQRRDDFISSLKNK